MNTNDSLEKVMLSDKVFLVTGAGSGMGRATALLLSKRGARVIVSDIDESSGLDTVRRIQSEGREAAFKYANVAVEDEVISLIDYCVDTFGCLDGAVNNAATAPDVRRIVDADMDQVDQVLSVNLRGMFVCMKYEISALMRLKRCGSIVNIGSITSVRPQAGNPAYVAAKHGVVGLTKTGAVEYAPYGIRVNAVLPGAIDTPMIQAALRQHGLNEKDLTSGLSLFERLGTPEEVAEASAWLCSEAASFVTGHSLAVDAGYLAR
jgi:glucose 1-dehydrogenase